MAAADDLTLANLGWSVWDFLRTPYRAPDENRIAGGQAAKPNSADRFVGNTLMSLATLPQRAIEASQHHLKTGNYDPGPVLEAAIAATTGGLPFAARGALGSAGGRGGQSPLPMDKASRMSRADAAGFRRDLLLEFGTAPAGERVAAASIRVGDRIFTGPSHAHAIMKAEKEFGAPLEALERSGKMVGDTAGGYLTTSGRFVSRWEAADIARRADQGDPRGRFASVRGAASHQLQLDPNATPQTHMRIGATAPALPDGQGV